MTLDRNTLLENVLSEFDEPLTKKDVRRLFAALAAELPEEPAVVWSEPRQMWNGQWYRVGSSTSATLSPQDATQQAPGSARASLDEGTVRVPREPAAWRWRYSPEHQWHYVEQEHQRSAQAYDWEPVYAATALERAEAEGSGRWISVDDGKPDKQVPVLVHWFHGDSDGDEVAHWNGMGWYHGHNDIPFVVKTVTHWQPIEPLAAAGKDR